MTTTGSHPATSRVTWPGQTAFGWILPTSLLIALVAPLPYLTTSLAEVAQRQNDIPIARNYLERPFAIQLALYVHAGFGGLALLVSPTWPERSASPATAMFDVAEPVASSRAYLVVPFLCWVPNLIVAEIYLRAAQRGV